MASNTVETRFKCDFFKLIDIFFPFLSISTTFLRADARARGQLQFVRINPVTIFLPLDFAFQQFAISSAPGTRADMFERASFTNPKSNSDLYQYLQLSGLYPPRILNGTKFLPTRLSGESCGVTGGAKLKIFRDSKSFWIQTGFGRVSNVIIPVSALPGLHPLKLLPPILTRAYRTSSSPTATASSTSSTFPPASPTPSSTQPSSSTTPS